MPTHPSSATGEPSPGADAAHPFASLGAGLGFFQDWMKAAGSALPHLQAGATGAASGVPAWSLPTLDPDELDKRIQDLKTVQFWLEQNARMIAMTIQGMEVQRMTLATLKGMNVSMDAVKDALKARGIPGVAPVTPSAEPVAAAPEAPDWMARARASAEAAGRPAEPPSATPRAAATEPDSDGPPPAGPQAELINPMRWWDTLTQQFTHLASQAAASAAAATPVTPATPKQTRAKSGAAKAQASQAEATRPSATRKSTGGTPRKPGSSTPRTPARRRGDTQAD